jgi:O-glycosyl hydrolase
MSSILRPTIDTPDNSVVLNTAGQQSVLLTGITDGDDGSQDLQVSAVSADEALVNNVTVEYTPNEATAILKYTPVAAAVGSVDIVVTVADLGGDATNDGNKSTEITFQVSTKNPSLPGYEFTLDEIGTWSPEGATSVPPVFTLAVVDSGSFKALKIDMNTKWEYGGIWIPLSSELDLSEYTYIQYDVYSVGVSTWHWNYFYDALGADASVNRNIANSVEHQYEVKPGQWTTLTFDYRDEGDINNTQGNPIVIDRVNALLLNMHNRKPAWPFTDFTGTVYYRNIRVGNAAQNVAPKIIYSTLDPVADRGFVKGDSVQSVLLTGISNGTGSVENCRVEVISSNKNVISKEFGSKVNEDGTATVSFEVGQTTGLSILTVRVKTEGTEDAVQQFRVNVADPEATGIMATVEVDKNETYQTMRGLGVFQFSSRHADIYTQELGASAIRIGIIGNQWEPENDNDDPNVLNMEGFNYDAFDWDYFRKLKENGVETFILTSWSPPAWMKRNLSLDHREQAIEWEKTDNILEPYYYEEFAESMVAVVKAFKEEADIDILALGLQNEPFFNEPYASAILSGVQFAKLIEVVGDRFAAEGLDHVGFFMPEQVFGLGWGGYSNEGYLNALKANPKADAYCDYFAVHGYDGSGITAGFPSYTNWQNLWTAAQTGDNPKEMWMTETHIGYSGFGSSMSLAGAIHGSLYAGNISLWTNWGFEDMQLTKNVPNTSFWASKNYFNYIRPGAVRVKATSNHADILVTSFINPDNSLVTVMINKSALAIPVTLSGADISDRYEVYRTSNKENCVFAGLISLEDGLFMVPANSITTLVSTSNALKLDKPADMKLVINSEAQELILTGISNGEASLDILELTAENSNPELITGLTLGSIMSDGTATLNFVPSAGNRGSAQITLTLSDGDNSYVTSFLVTVYDPAVMVKDITIAKMELYPNPASDYLSVVVPEGYHTISIRDISGRLVYKQTITRTTEIISLGGIEKGVYLIEAEGGNQRIVNKFVIK